ncbi:U4/U6 small nuclear ribonucleoprotein Prp31 [Durusdinium trenchii]|uniref:U4/U6 small nuclear ribonucleoprotein Prp31 n=1 Tax=Durusdinium trenchii TaxID=1381693 RepID=A0ABP0L8G1_9DINO
MSGSSRRWARLCFGTGFVPVPECNEYGPPGQRVTKCEWTPLTAHLVKARMNDALKLKTALYDPFPGDNSKMEKIVDAAGHNAGYATFVETMAKEAEDRLKIFLGHEVVGLRRAQSGPGSVVVSVKGPDKKFEVEASAVLLNIPQLPLLRLLRASSEVDAKMSPPPDLFAPSSMAILKLYVHYEDAWWRNYLQHVGGEFSNMYGSFSAWEAPYQFPLPLEGRYWDGDYRCDGDDPKRPCRGKAGEVC